MLDFSQRLKQLRRDRHLTQAQVAKRIGVTAAMVSSYETDIRLPSYEVMVRLADCLRATFLRRKLKKISICLVRA